MSSKLHKVLLFLSSIYFIQYSGLSFYLPQNVHVLTFEPWKDNSALIRFEHILSKGEDSEYSKNVTFNFEDVFRKWGVTSIRETTLAANQWLSDSVRLQFNPETQSSERLLILNDEAITQIIEPQMSEFNIHPEISNRQYRKTMYRNFQRDTTADSDAFQITLHPMQIRTYILGF